MITYVGYGFCIDDITNEAWLALVNKYDHDAYESFIRDGLNTEDIQSFIDENAMSQCEYLRDIINENEKSIAKTDYIVSSYDDYLVFDSIRFYDDSPRAKYIPNQEAFISMIARYIDIDTVNFGNVYEGSDWIDPSFFIE